MRTELTEVEEQWISQWRSLIDKTPSPLVLMIDEESAGGAVGVYLPDRAQKKLAHMRWINRMNRHLEQFPSGDCWLLQNVDGWHFGKGDPAIFSQASYGTQGACGSYSDNYAEHYHESVSVACGQVPNGYELLGHLDSEQGSRDTTLITGED